MGKLSDTSSRPFAKLMLIGPSKVGKSSALACLAKAGYRLNILDVDCKVPGSYLHTLLKDDPASLERVSFMQFRDVYNSDGTPRGKPGATPYDEARKTMDKWEDGTSPREWGHEGVYVIDTLNLLSTMAFNASQIMNPNWREGRLHYKGAQLAINGFIGSLFSDYFTTNVIITSHIKEIALERKYVNKTDAKGNVTTEFAPVAGSPVKQFPSTIGEALSKEIAVYSNELYRMEVTGAGAAMKREIVTRSDAKMDMGSGLKLPPRISAEDGLLTIFKELTK